MEISNVRDRFDDELSIEPKVKAQNPVRRWMLWAHRQDHLRLKRRVEGLIINASRNVFNCSAHMIVWSYAFRRAASAPTPNVNSCCTARNRAADNPFLTHVRRNPRVKECVADQGDPQKPHRISHKSPARASQPFAIGARPYEFWHRPRLRELLDANGRSALSRKGGNLRQTADLLQVRDRLRRGRQADQIPNCCARICRRPRSIPPER